MAVNPLFPRRHFLRAAGALTGSAALGAASLALAAEAPPAAGTENPPRTAPDAAAPDPACRGRMFFTNALAFATLEEAAERIFPEDEAGPGAKKLAVAYFIDNQLASAYGCNDREYMAGPFAEGAPTQGTQTPMQRRSIFLLGIEALNAQAMTVFNKTFASLEDARKDEILSRCEAGKLPMEGVSSSVFFVLLRRMVLAGVYADPIYNGNKNMDGWKMKQFPGAQMEYSDVVLREEFTDITPMSLADM